MFIDSLCYYILVRLYHINEDYIVHSLIICIMYGLHTLVYIFQAAPLLYQTEWQNHRLVKY